MLNEVNAFAEEFNEVHNPEFMTEDYEQRSEAFHDRNMQTRAAIGWVAKNPGAAIEAVGKTVGANAHKNVRLLDESPFTASMKLTEGALTFGMFGVPLAKPGARLTTELLNAAPVVYNKARNAGSVVVNMSRQQMMNLERGILGAAREQTVGFALDASLNGRPITFEFVRYASKQPTLTIDPRASYPKTSMSELLRSGEKIGTKGITLTDKQVDFADLWRLTVKHEGIEVAITKELISGQSVYRVYGGDLQKVLIPRQATVLAHTHPESIAQRLPSYEDINQLNRKWNILLEVDQAAPPPYSRVIWGPTKDHITLFKATGVDINPKVIIKRKTLFKLGLDKDYKPL